MVTFGGHGLSSMEVKGDPSLVLVSMVLYPMSMELAGLILDWSTEKGGILWEGGVKLFLLVFRRAPPTISEVGRLKWPPLSLEDCLEWCTLEKRPLEDSDPWRWKEESPDRIEDCRECWPAPIWDRANGEWPRGPMGVLRPEPPLALESLRLTLQRGERRSSRGSGEDDERGTAAAIFASTAARRTLN